MSTEIIDFKQYPDIHRIPDFKMQYLPPQMQYFSVVYESFIHMS